MEAGPVTGVGQVDCGTGCSESKADKPRQRQPLHSGET